MDLNQKPTVTRFAPSPTGFLHIGGVRTALYAWLWARKNKGTFILRIEDTDKAREVEGSIKHIQESLEWLGLDWNYGPDKPGSFGSCLQSERLDTYKKYAQQLVNKGLAYPDPYTEEELLAFREEAKESSKPFLFRNHRPKVFEQWDGDKPLRFKVTDIKRHTWQDAVRGELSAGEEALDDIIIMKADGFPTYNFAHIIDDHEMEVTHVMRGEEFISSTPKFLSLYDALELPQPIFVTLPPIMGPDGKKKLSKRDGAKDLLDYRADGYLPEAMRNFLALIGWNPGGDQELFGSGPHSDQLMNAFSLEKIQKSGGAFNEEKLRWMNKQYLSTSKAEFLISYLDSGLPENLSTEANYAENLKRLAPVIFERVSNLVDIKTAANLGEYDWAFKTPTYNVELLHWKKDMTIGSAKPRLYRVMELLETCDFSSPDAIKSTIWEYVEEAGKGEVLWPLRIALSGQEKSPDPFTIAYILGPKETNTRIKTAYDKIKK